MNQESRGELTFEDWLSLAESDPAAFEAKRREAVESVINQAPPEVQQRLRSLQWRIDRTRELASTPMSSVMALSNMMWDNYRYLNGLLHQLANPEKVQYRSPGATILQFSRELQPAEC